MTTLYVSDESRDEFNALEPSDRDLDNLLAYSLTEDELTELFDDYLNEIDQIVRVAGLDYLPADVLKNCDPTAYRVMLSDYSADYLEVNGDSYVVGSELPEL